MKKRILIILAIIIVAIIALFVAVKYLPLAYTITVVVAFLCGIWVSYLIRPKADVYKND